MLANSPLLLPRTLMTPINNSGALICQRRPYLGDGRPARAFYQSEASKVRSHLAFVSMSIPHTPQPGEEIASGALVAGNSGRTGHTSVGRRQPIERRATEVSVTICRTQLSVEAPPDVGLTNWQSGSKISPVLFISLHQPKHSPTSSHPLRAKSRRK